MIDSLGEWHIEGLPWQPALGCSVMPKIIIKSMNPGPRTPSEKHYGNAPKQTVHVREGKHINLKFRQQIKVTDTIRQRVVNEISASFVCFLFFSFVGRSLWLLKQKKG